jgi:peptidoglycan-binding domain 1 protein
MVDEGYELGDRTLYLRLPNFHGNDVRQLQERLNILGFSCGKVDGHYGVHTEAAVKLFQESVGELADGMAFQDTLDAIERLRHVWSGKQAKGPHPQGPMGFARAANVLETTCIAITGEDPISRNVAARVYNLSKATTEASGMTMIDRADSPTDAATILVLTTAYAPSMPARGQVGIGSVSMEENETLPARLRTAIESADATGSPIKIVLPEGTNVDGSFTTADAQTLAVLVLDAICGAFASLS